MTNNKLNKVSDVVIARLAVYLRELEQIIQDGKETECPCEVISSHSLAKRLTISAGQIRKDLSQFGDFGKQGQSYPICQLINTLRRILNAHHIWPIILVGVGQLGRALTHSDDLEEQGFQIAAVFDNDEAKIGQVIQGHHIHHINNLSPFVEAFACRIGIICTPAPIAQAVTDDMIKAGIESILSYAATALIVPEAVRVQYIDPVVYLRQMTYHLNPSPTLPFISPDRESFIQVPEAVAERPEDDVSLPWPLLPPRMLHPAAEKHPLSP